MNLTAVHGVPDDGVIGARLNDAQDAAVIEWPGRTCLLGHLAPLGFDFADIWLGPAMSGKTSVRLPEGRPLFNDLADADTYGFALVQLEKLAAASGAPVFNRPGAVLNSRRDRAPERLGGVDGLDVPGVVRIRADRRDAVLEAIANAGLSFPLILRTAGEHSGKNVVKVDNPGDIAALDQIPWGGRALYAIEFRDFRDPDGRYRKHRLIWAGGEVLLRHVIIGDAWNLHARDRSGADLEEEERRLTTFDAGLRASVEPVVSAMADRLGLDYFGVDCHISADGKITLFEANAAMNLPFNTRPSPNIWDKPIRRMMREVAELLRNPDRWRWAETKTFEGYSR